VAYSRFKFRYEFPSGVEIVAEKADEAPYAAAEKKSIVASETDPGIGIRRVHVVWTRTSETAGMTEDVALCTHDFMNMTGGEPDDTWTAGDFTTLEGFLTTFYGTLAAFWDDSADITQYRWYRIGPRVNPPNPPVKVQTVAINGAGSAAMLPPQVAISVTERTAVRRCWGRFYLPSISSATLETTGRIKATSCTSIANAVDTCYKAAQAAGFQPVVYSKARAKAFSVESLQVDDLYDVQRRRRFDRPAIRELRTGV
jgi:hypothetical protein